MTRKKLQRRTRILKEKTVPMSKDDSLKLLNLSEDWSLKSKWQHIDETLYGEKKRYNKKIEGSRA
jgi:hypothetical protein